MSGGLSGSEAGSSMAEYKRRLDNAEKREKFEECLEICREVERISAGDKEIQLTKAKFLVLTGQFDAANDILGEKLKENPLNAEAIFVLGLIFYYRGNLKKSVEVFDNALQLDGSMSHARNLKTKATRLISIFNESEKIWVRG
jgi:tetratricopeptide (TPR) repeat protein